MIPGAALIEMWETAPEKRRRACAKVLGLRYEELAALISQLQGNPAL